MKKHVEIVSLFWSLSYVSSGSIHLSISMSIYIIWKKPAHGFQLLFEPFWVGEWLVALWARYLGNRWRLWVSCVLRTSSQEKRKINTQDIFFFYKHQLSDFVCIARRKHLKGSKINNFRWLHNRKPQFLQNWFALIWYLAQLDKTI